MGKKTDEIRRRIKIAEEKKGRRLFRKEREVIEKAVIKEFRRKNAIKAVLVALGITTIGAAGKHALLPEGNNNKIEKQETLKRENNEFIKGLQSHGIKIDTEKFTKELQNEEIIFDILKEYNEKYGTELNKEDISYIKSKPQFLGIDENGTYIQDYKENTPVKEYEEEEEKIGNIYIMINNKDNKIISSLGEVSSEITNIDTKIVMDRNGTEYLESDKKINIIEGKDEQTKQKIYEALEQEYEKEYKKQIQENYEEIQDDIKEER